MSEISFRSPSGVSSTTPITVDSNYKSTYSLNMFKNTSSQGLISWVDMGLQYDTIKTKFDIEMENIADYLKDFENNLKGGQYETITPIISDAVGFYPLTPLYKSCVISGETPIDKYYELSITNKPQTKNLMITNKAVRYAIESVPNGLDLTLADTYPTCGNFTGWTLDGLDLPYTKNVAKGRLNIADKSHQLNKGAYNAKRYKRDFGETVNITMVLDEEKTRQLLSKLSVLRGSSFNIHTPLKYNFFAHLYPTNTSFNCILSKSDIVMEFVSHKNIKVSFSIQLLEVN